MQAEFDEVLRASDPATREAAWQRFVAHYSRLLLAVARSFGGGQDEAMERYAFLLEKLAEKECQRLVAFRPDGRASFSTWLTVTARRLCLDHLRARYGRARTTLDPQKAGERRTVRRRLADSLVAEVDPDLLADSDSASAESEAIRAERDARLHAELAALPARDRLLLALRFEDGLPASRIAGLMQFPTVFHVYRRLNAILPQLRAALESRGIGGSEG